MLSVSILLLVLMQDPRSVPELRIEGSGGVKAAQAYLESLDSKHLADVMRLVGLRSAGPPIHIELAAETSEWAGTAPKWVAGFALGSSNMVVIFPSRSPSYPDSSLEDVLRHEIAHVLIFRAASGQAIPRWFNEGLALSAERGWRFRDQTQLLVQLVSGSRETTAQMDRLFEGSQADQNRAYLLSGALVRQILNHYGETTGARILQRVGDGLSFDAAFADVTGRSPDVEASEFWRRQRVWTTWLPILFSQETMWMAITLLALLAIRRRRRRNAEIETKWEEEDDA